MLGVTVKVTGDPMIKLRSVVERLSAPVALADQMAAHAAGSMRSNIDESHFPDGTEYPALSPKYAAWKQKHGFPITPLKRTMEMYNSIAATPAVIAGGRIVSSAGPNLADVPYFPYQDMGAPRADVPERRFIGISSGVGTGSDVEIYQAMADEYAAETVEAVVAVTGGGAAVYA